MGPALPSQGYVGNSLGGRYPRGIKLVFGIQMCGRLSDATIKWWMGVRVRVRVRVKGKGALIQFVQIMCNLFIFSHLGFGPE